MSENAQHKGKPSDNCHCQKCQNNWFSTMLYWEGRLPKTCPRCHSYTWMEPLKRKSRRKNKNSKQKGKK